MTEAQDIVKAMGEFFALSEENQRKVMQHLLNREQLLAEVAKEKE